MTDVKKFIKSNFKITEGPTNFRLMQIVSLTCNEKDIFEDIIKYFNDMNYDKLERTNSGGISIIDDYKPRFDVSCYKWGFELTFIYIDYHSNSLYRGRIQLGHPKDKIDYSGRKALNRFKKDCEKAGIDLDKYAVENGKEVKETIEKPMIDVDENYLDKTLTNCHHIDFHSSHPAGMIKYYPELAPIINHYYKMRKKNSIYKYQLNMLWGAMQSPHLCSAKWAEISKAGIHDTNARLKDITEKLIKSGRKVIAHNTDGVWYQGNIYHDENEGKNIGQYENDHTNCTLRYKTKGAYEFIEDNKYYPVIRGLTKLDKIKDRTEWQWGDIYQEEAEIDMWDLSEEIKEIVKKYEN